MLGVDLDSRGMVREIVFDCCGSRCSLWVLAPALAFLFWNLWVKRLAHPHSLTVDFFWNPDSGINFEDQIFAFPPQINGLHR